MTDLYILDNQKPYPCEDLKTWAQWMENNSRVVKQETVNNSRISTVFLGLDHNFFEGEPLLFETMIFGGQHDHYQKRCSTWERALLQHQHAIELVKGKWTA